MQQLQVAVQAYQVRDLDGAEAIFKQILAVNPKEPNALHLLGCIHKDRGQLQQAVDLIQASIQVDGSNPIPFLNLGKIHAISGQHENAVGVFKESLKRNQQIPETWFYFAIALREIEKIEEAKQAYRNVLQLNSAHAGSAGNLGALLTHDDELDEAEEVLRSALERNPEDINCLINFGNVLKEEGNVKEAIASYRKAIEIKPDFADAKKALLRCQGENGIREQVTIEAYREQMEGKDEVGILIAAYSSFEAIPSDRRSVNSWIEDKNENYFAGQMFGSVFVDLPWIKTKSFAESSSLLIPKAGHEYLDAVDINISSIKTLQIRMSQAPVISSLLESLARKKGGPIEVIDVGGWSGNALFLAGFNDSWDVVKSWKVIETEAVCVPAREQLLTLLDSLPEGSAGKRNLGKLSFEELGSFYGSSPASENVDLIWTSTAQHYNAFFPRDLDALLSRGAELVYFDTFPYLCSSNPALNVCEFTELGVSDQMVSFLMNQRYLSELIVNAAKKYGYSAKIWSQLIEPNMVFWQPQEGDKVLPKEIKDDAKPLLMKSCCIRFDRLD